MARNAPDGCTPAVPPRVAVAPDGSFATIHDGSHVAIIELPRGSVCGEIGVDPDAVATEVAWLGAPPRVLVVSRYAGYCTAHLLAPAGPRPVAEIRLESAMQLYATVGSSALLGGALGAAVLGAGEAHLTPYQFPARGAPLAAGAAGCRFVVALPASIEEWDPQSRLPRRRLRLPRTAAITAVGGSDRLVWMTTQQEPTRIDVIPLINRGQPRAHDLPEPIAAIAGHPRSDLVACLGADTGRLYIVDLDGRTRMRAAAADGIAQIAAVGLVIGPASGVLAVQADLQAVYVALDGREPAIRTAASQSDAALPDDGAALVDRGRGHDHRGWSKPVMSDRLDSGLRSDAPVEGGAGAEAATVIGAHVDGSTDPRAPAGSGSAHGRGDLPRPGEGELDAGRAPADDHVLADDRASPDNAPPLTTMGAGLLAKPELDDRPALPGSSEASASAHLERRSDEPQLLQREAADRGDGEHAASLPEASGPSVGAGPQPRTFERGAGYLADTAARAQSAVADVPPALAAPQPALATPQPALATPQPALAAPPPALATSSPAVPPPLAAPPRSWSAPGLRAGAADSAVLGARRVVAPEPAAARSSTESNVRRDPRRAERAPRAENPTKTGGLAGGGSWRDDVVAWSRAIAGGSEATGAPSPPLIDALLARFDLAPSLAPVLVLLYGAHLCGERGVAPVDVARLLDRQWDEALGRGELADRGVAEYAGSRVALSAVVLRVLDELPPRTGVVVGVPGPVSLVGPCVAVARGDEPLADVAERCVPRIGGAILAARGEPDRGALLLEARARGAAAMLRATFTAVPNVAAIFVIGDAQLADRLGVPRLA